MSYWVSDHLKIEFRAVPYASEHALEYRISPNQKLDFETDEKFLWFKYKKKRKYKTDWHTVRHFVNYPSAYLHDEEDCYLPIFIRKRNELEFYKESFHTYGEFIKWLNKKEEPERSSWKVERMNYLHEKEDWY